ncbi:MAG: Polyribonucleotide nucleotidyltransferase, partial [Bacteroidota bacterium]|nr:Polyribonucleotide nucleotidyltransferase [Bacteroidota bacterium]
VEVKIIDIDPKTGKMKLSRKVLLPRPPKEDHEHDRKPPEDLNK